MNKQHRLAYEAIDELKQDNQGVVTTLLRFVGVSRQAYYQGRRRQTTVWEAHDCLLKERVKYWFDFHHQGIGAGNILVNLEHDNQVDFEVSIKQVKRCMRELGLTCQVRRKWRHHQPNPEQYIKDNVLNQEFAVNHPNEVWLADSTELAWGLHSEHKVRLSGVLDLFGRRLLAANITPTETAAAEIEVFKRAFDQAGTVSPLIHTDRGSAYTSNDFNAYLDGLNVTRSMSRPGTPYDNAPMERWWNEFKSRWMARHPVPQTYAALVKLVNEGIEYFNHYNRSAQRNGLTPDEYWSEAA